MQYNLKIIFKKDFFMSTELPNTKNKELLQNTFGEEIVNDLQERYPQALNALLMREPIQIEKILSLQTQIEDIIHKLAAQLGINESMGVVDVMHSLSSSTLEQTKRELESMNSGKVMISVAGPGGAGKDTVLKGLITLLEGTHIDKAVCTTTRAVRADDTPGKSYHFKDQEYIENLLTSAKISDEHVLTLGSLGISNINVGDRFSKELLEKIKDKSGVRGITIFFESVEGVEEHALYLTYNPGRGWYTILNTEVNRAAQSPISVVIEDPQIVTRIIQSREAKDRNFLGKVICVLPPHPIIMHMALRAISRDEILANRELSFEQLMSTIGERQIALVNEFSRIPSKFFILVVNDRLQDGIPTASYLLADVFKTKK